MGASKPKSSYVALFKTSLLTPALVLAVILFIRGVSPKVPLAEDRTCAVFLFLSDKFKAHSPASLAVRTGH